MATAMAAACTDGCSKWFDALPPVMARPDMRGGMAQTQQARSQTRSDMP